MEAIFLHGLGQSPECWNKTLAALPESIKADCPGIFNMPGACGMDYGSIYGSFENYAAGFPEPVNLCGLSLGAVLALDYAVSHAGKVRSLVLIAPQYKMPRLLLKFQNMVFRMMPKRSFAETGLTKEDMIQLTGSMCTLDFQNGLSGISCPVLIVCGKRDTANIKAAKALAEILPDARLRLIAHAGHEVNREASDELAAAIHRFYEEENIL